MRTPMSFRDFTLPKVQQDFGLTTDATQQLFAKVATIDRCRKDKSRDGRGHFYQEKRKHGGNLGVDL
jgi:hypothetical protein